MICFYVEILTGKRTAYAFFTRAMLVEEPTSDSLVATSLHVFSKGPVFFPFLFSPFFPWLLVVHGSLASCAAYKLALKTSPKQFQGVVTVGITQRKAALPILPGAGMQGEKDQSLKPIFQWSISQWGSSPLLLPMVQPFPTLWFTKMQKWPFLFQPDFSRGFHTVWKWLKLVVPNIWDFSLHTQTLWVSSRVYSLAPAA